MGVGWRKVPNWECLFVHRKQGFFLSVFVDHIRMVGKTLMKFVDLGEPTSFLAHVYLGCIQRECKPNESIIDQYRKCSNHKFLLEQLKITRVGKDLTQRRLCGPAI